MLFPIVLASGLASRLTALETRLLFVPQTGIACELQAEAKHGVQGQLLIFHNLWWLWEDEGTFGGPREMMSITKN